MIKNTVFVRKYVRFSITFLSAISKLRREDIFKPTIGMAVYIRIVTVMVLE